MNIHRLQPAHAASYRALMLDAYAAHPDAFTSSVAERAALPLPWREARLAAGAAPTEIVLAAGDGSELLGVAGLSFETREKVRHKATLFGMYVAPAYRGQGIGRKLVAAALEHARSRPGLRIVQLTVTHRATARPKRSTPTAASCPLASNPSPSRLERNLSSKCT